MVPDRGGECGDDVFSYAGLKYATMNVLFGKAAGGTNPRWLLGRHRVTSNGSWDADVLPDEDIGATGPDGTRPRPRDHAAGGAYRVGTAALTRLVMFGGKDSTDEVRNDVWWLVHTGGDQPDNLRWFRFNTVTGLAEHRPTDGLWKHSAIVNENTGTLWVWGGVDKFGAVSNAMFQGEVVPSDPDGRTWKWTRHDQPNGPGARQLASAAFDEQYNRMIVYGGYTDAAGSTVTSDNDVYAFDLVLKTWAKLDWSSAQSSARPEALAEASLTPGPTSGEHLTSGPKANMYLYGGATASAVKADVWLMYFPTATQVSWVRLNVDPATIGPGARKGATAIRDHDSWNLRVFGGVGPAGAATDGKVYRIDIYRDSDNPTCDQLKRPWVAQFGDAYSGGGTTGSLVVFDPYEVPATTVEWRHPEAAATSPWTQVSNSPDRFQHFYPLLFPLPDNTILDVMARLAARTTFRFLPGTGLWEQFPSAITPPELAALDGGSAVMRRLVDGTYDIMKCGIKDTGVFSAHGLTARLKLTATGAVPASGGWVASESMQGRVFHNLVTLPDGKVLVTGGTSVNSQVLSTNTTLGVKRPQIWDPAGSGSWTDPALLADEGLLRGYHTSALLMPDGRVLTGGGNDDASVPDKHKFAVFAPPQWFDANGNHATTVTASILPNRIGYGVSTRVDMAVSVPVEKVVLIRPGAVTHGFNSSQVYSELTFATCPNGGYGGLTITTPPSGKIPQGDYLLFAVAGGRWSTGQWLRLESGAPTTYPGVVPEPCSNGCVPTEADPLCDGGDGGGGFYLGGTSAHRDPGAFAARPGETLSPTWVTNTLFAGAADGAESADRLRLDPGPVQDGAVSRVQLRHRGAGSDSYTRVRLVAVDHAAGDEALSTPAGVVVGDRQAAISVRDVGGIDISATLGSAEGLSLSAGDVLTVTLPAAADGGSLWLATSGHPADEGGIRIEQQLAEGWREVAVHTPRARRDMQVVSGLGSSTLRLVALGQHRLYGVGRFVPGAASTSNLLPPVSVDHSVAGSIPPDGAFELASGDLAWVDFVTPATAEGTVRDWFLEVTGTPQGYRPSAAALNSRHAIIDEPLGRITSFRLAGGIPNPFTSGTRVLFELPRAATVRLEVFDMQGRLVQTVEERFEAGVRNLVWDRRTTSGAYAPRGVYPIRVTAGSERATGRLTVR